MFNYFHYFIVLFIHGRKKLKDAANIISAGGDGHLRFYHMEHANEMWSVQISKDPIFAMCLNNENNILVTADASVRNIFMRVGVGVYLEYRGDVPRLQGNTACATYPAIQGAYPANQ